MYLVNASTLQLEYFDREIPLYVILSHTWGTGEVSFDSINMPHACSLSGYQKIQLCCEQAVEDGYDYVWIDTCCIDKRSSAELSENINSMYEYYKKAQKCYAFLTDVPSEEELSKLDSKFRRSRWFTRGWTLQELIAPEIVEFYSYDWIFLGTKRGLVELVEKITGIPRQILHNSGDINKISTAQKFSWLSLRTTTRDEDMAYCMLGIMGVNMPLLYGEGQEAFIRLQRELVKHSRDLTFLCWEHTSGMLVKGPFCGDPRAFTRGSQIQWSDTTDSIPFTVTNRGLEIQLPIMCEDGHIAVVPKCCWHSPDGIQYSVGIRLRKLASTRKTRSQGYQRVYESMLEFVRASSTETAMEEKIHIRGLKMEYLDYIKENKTSESVPIMSIKIAGIECTPNGHMQLRRFIAGGRIGSGTTESFKHDHVPQVSFKGYEVYQDKCVGCLVRCKDSDIFIAFGLQTSGVWFITRSDIFENQMIDALSEAFLHRTIMISQKHDKGTRVFDRTTLIAENGTMVTMSMKKKRNRSQGRTYWELNIFIESQRTPLMNHENIGVQAGDSQRDQREMIAIVQEARCSLS